MRAWIALVLAIAVAGACSSDRDPRGTLVLWHSYGGDERAALEQVVADLNQRSWEVRIELVSVPHEVLADKLTSAIPNGNGPDLFIYPGHDRTGHWSGSGLLEPIDFFVDDELADRYSPPAITALAYGGSLYGLPLAVKSLALFYRTDRIEQAPTTTDELIAMARAQTESGSYGLVYDNADLYGHAPWLHGFGGELFDDAGQVALASPQAVRAAEFAASLVGEGGIVPAGMTPTLVSTLFNEDKAAMAISGPWFIGDIAADVPYAVAPLPRVSETGLAAAPFLGVEGVFMSPDARDKDLAFRVMVALADDASAQLRAARAGQIVPNLAAHASSATEADPIRAAFVAQAQVAVPMPASPEMRMVWTPYESALQRILGQGQAPSIALDQAQHEVVEYIAGATR